MSEGILRIEKFNPLLRIEAHRLQGRSCASLGRSADACAAAERAVAEAAAAKYVWLEWLSLKDLLAWCEASEREEVRSRLHHAAERMAAPSDELELVEALGEGIL